MWHLAPGLTAGSSSSSSSSALFRAPSRRRSQDPSTVSRKPHLGAPDRQPAGPRCH
ncbi:hypothetical protein GQ607_000327 [Colletotrichum asianum]|uniref:Uncharacterized protein n=1 Tax=Colletotrichum asianum TaxID=702518 RepID=A0A8H3WPG5_9PEZI|nr:hypothetical protein GQ607_000327 [Colletotrichum asianum]